MVSLRHHNVVSFSEISWDCGMKWDVRENSWCLWCLLVKSREISAWNETCERFHGVCGVFKDTTDTTNSLAHRGDQELSKTFHRLKIGPLLRKLQAFKHWQFFDFYEQLKWCRNDGKSVTWKPCGVHIETTWCLCENHIVSTWKPHAVYMQTM